MGVRFSPLFVYVSQYRYDMVIYGYGINMVLGYQITSNYPFPSTVNHHSQMILIGSPVKKSHVMAGYTGKVYPLSCTGSEPSGGATEGHTW